MSSRYITMVVKLTADNDLPFDTRVGEYCPHLNGTLTAMSLSNSITELEALEGAIHTHAHDPYELEEALAAVERMHDQSVRAHREAAQKRIQAKVNQDGQN